MKKLFLLLTLLPLQLLAQKEIYIPNEWTQTGFDYSLDRAAESGNFIVFWGPLAGDDPTQAPSEIAFDPQLILDTAEELYRFYIDTIRFVDDDAGLISQYKIILVMLHTWTGLEGWAFGGNYDGVVGAMWMHPHAASSGPTLAHEFTHTLQNYAWMMHPGHGFIDSSYVGFFWEAHAEFMALQKYPSVALEYDMARWLNTCHFHWSSTRHHYQAFLFLEMIREKDGIEMINRLWRESLIGEHPLETYKRLKGIGQPELNQLFAEHAMRNVTWDYNIGDLLRTRESTINPVFIAHRTIIPEQIDSAKNWYRIQNYLAPQDYGYNIIQLHPEMEPGCNKRIVYINFEAQWIFPDYQEAGLLFGFVAVDGSGQPRYSEVFVHDEILFELEDDETELYLVVIGAPTAHHNYAWEIGFPKIYRYPYEFRLKNAKPEGYQPGFNPPPDGIPGAPHANGGGFVASSAHVDASAYIGPQALVLDNAIVTGAARIEDFAIVKHNAEVSDAATVSDYAIIGESAKVHDAATVGEHAHIFGESNIYGLGKVYGSSLIFSTQVYDEALVSDNTFCWGATLHGDVKLGGDAEFFRDCSDGTYLQVQDAYGRNCDGLDDHPANVDVTERFSDAFLQNDYTLLCDQLVENYFEYLEYYICEGDTFYFNGIPYADDESYVFEYVAVSGVDSIITLSINYILTPQIIFHPSCPGDTIWIEGIALIPGVHYDTILQDPFSGCDIPFKGTIPLIEIDSTVLISGSTLEVQQPAYTIQWYDCVTNMPVADADDKTFTPILSGSYKAYIVSWPDTCAFFTECLDIIGTATGDPRADYYFSIHPNPASNDLQVQLVLPSYENMKMEIVDVTGKSWHTASVMANSNSYSLNVASLPPGLYFLNLQTDHHIHTGKRFIKI